MQITPSAAPLGELILERGYKCGVEVGVWVGTSSRFLLGLPSIEKLYLVDPWLTYPEVTKTQKEIDSYAEYVIKNTKRFGDRVEVLRTWSLQGAMLVPTDLDFVYLDGAHDYYNVRNDIMAWRFHVAKGGILCGDDYSYEPYGNKHGFNFEVHKAVDQFYGDVVKFRPFGCMEKNEPAEDTGVETRTYPKRFWYVEEADLSNGRSR